MGLSLTSSSTGSEIWGIVRRTGGSATVYNNMVSLGLNLDGTSITTGYSIVGIYDESSTAGSGSFNYYYNSVYIGGSGVISASTSYAVLSTVIVNTRNFVDNIFINERSNSASGGASHYSMYLFGTGVDPTGLTSDYNDLYVSGTDGVVGFYGGANRLTLADWQTATGQDDNSSSVPVDFVDPATGSLDLDVLSIGDKNLIGTPIPGIDVDIHKDPRDPTFPYMGADEGDEALPVEMSSFTSSVSGNDVTLFWATSSERNNAGFEIERTFVNGTWTRLGNISGNGTTTNVHSYSFTDGNVPTGNYNYRLKQIDYNGNFSFINLSNEVNVGIPTIYQLAQNYPNPFNPITRISYDLPFDGKVSLKIFDMTGREILTLVNEVKTAGYYSVEFNASSLSSGIYFYILSANDFTATKKMTLLK